MRVALVCPYSWSVPGGVQTHIVGLAAALRARGVEVDVLAPADDERSTAHIYALGRSIPIPSNGSKVRVALTPAAAARTASRLAAGRYDVVHLHEPMIPAVCFTALLTSRAALVGTFHMYAAGPHWYRPFGPLARAVLGRLDARLAVSGAARRHVERTCPGRYEVVPNGLDVAPLAALAPDHDGGRRILFVGRPEPRKGLPVLLDALGRIPAPASLDLVGVRTEDLSREDARSLRKLGERVAVHGRVSAEERDRLLGSADVLCAPSLGAESFGLVLLEGMAAGLPVVASAVDGYSDLLPDSCGRLVPPGDAGGLASALSELLADPDLRRRMGAAGTERAWRYDWSSVAGRILEVYEDALRTRRKRRAPRYAHQRTRTYREQVHMATTPLHRLSELGQSVWIDYLSRDLLHTGELERMMREDAVVGITSNPTIFQKALAHGTAYDHQMRELQEHERDPKEIFIALAARDVDEACELLLPVWDSGSGRDGYVSIEVDPNLAHDTEATIAEAQRLHDLIDRRNLLVKIPATREGLPAIEEMIARGRSINVTLIFSLSRYADVADAYIAGLERLVGSGGDPRHVASVASFFVSRVDTEADRRLDELGHPELQGQLAVANARLAYQRYREIFASERWRALAEQGATPQRCLWASTSTKNPAYRDVLYVEELIGPETVNTMPEETIEAFQNHGEVAPTLERGVDDARALLERLASVGVDYDDVTDTLEREGVEKFAASYRELIEGIEAKRGALSAA